MDGSIGSALFGVVITIVVVVSLVVASIVGGVIYILSNKGALESKTILIPEIKLTTDGKVIDTIYVYRKVK